MYVKLRQWVFRFMATILLLISLLLIIILYPSLSYANKTVFKNITIYHNAVIDTVFIQRVQQALSIAQQSVMYSKKIELDICLNDGSVYPSIIKAIRGKAFAWGFYNKVVLQGEIYAAQNYMDLNGYHWKLSELLAHEITHCMQFNHLGLWHSKPIANIPEWKWEGFAEYLSRKKNNEIQLADQIQKYVNANKDLWEIQFEDSTIAPLNYFLNAILVQYCLEIKKMSFDQLITDTSNEADINKEMMLWYQTNKQAFD